MHRMKRKEIDRLNDKIKKIKNKVYKILQHNNLLLLMQNIFRNANVKYDSNLNLELH